MPGASSGTFLDTLRKSGLVPEPELAEHLAVHQGKRGGQVDHAALASDLQAAGVVTAWQAKMLARGVSNGYFLGKNKLLGRLGAGGMGVVYLAEHVTLQRRVAIKVLDLKNSTHTSSVARFFRESRVTAALDHPNIVRVYDFDSVGGHHFLVMEYVDGPNLQELVERHGPLKPETAAQYAMQSVAGLGTAHRAGLVHRDVKPANLMVNSHGIVKVTDLGLARAEQGESLKLTLEDGGMLGTADYISPEQAMDSHRVSPASDVYSLGCTFYFLLTGGPPFSDGSLARKLMRHQLEKPAPPSTCRPGIPAAVGGLCERMLLKDPAKRPTSEEVRIELRDWLQAEGHGLASEDPRLFARGPSGAASTAGDTMSGSAPAGATLADRRAQGRAASPTADASSSLNLCGPASSISTGSPGISSVRSDSWTRVRLVCPGCGAGAFAPQSSIGATVVCPKCGGTLAASTENPAFPA